MCGVKLISAPLLADPTGLWFAGPDGVPQQLIVSEKCTPDAKATRTYAPEQSVQGRAPRRSAIWQVQPRRLSHILTFTADVDSTAQFYMGVLVYGYPTDRDPSLSLCMARTAVIII
jgi:hypothetical protein